MAPHHLCAVGAAKFSADAKELMNVLIQLYQSDGHAQEADDPFRSYVLAAWARICSGTVPCVCTALSAEP